MTGIYVISLSSDKYYIGINKEKNLNIDNIYNNLKGIIWLERYYFKEIVLFIPYEVESYQIYEDLNNYIIYYILYENIWCK